MRILVTSFLILFGLNVNSQNFVTEHLINQPSYNPSNTKMADIDSDGDNDFVSVSQSGEIIWYEQNVITQTYKTHYIEDIFSSLNLNNVAISDIDGDGDQDIITISSSVIPAELRWYINDGNQNFSHVLIPSNLNNSNVKIEVVDIDNDSDLDIITTKSDLLMIYENDGVQNFTEIIAFTASYIINDFSIDDFDGNNLTDISLTTDNGTSILLQNNINSFKENIISSAISTSIDVGDLDNDGFLDLAIRESITNTSTPKIYFYYNQGDDSTFTKLYIKDGEDVNLKDVDGDNDLDLVYLPTTTLTRYGVIINDNTPSFNNSNPIERTNSTNVSGKALLVEDFNMDGKFDIINTISQLGKIDLYIADNIPSYFGSRIEVTQSAGLSTDISVADFNNDGSMDIVGASPGDATIEWFENTGDDRNYNINPIDTIFGIAKNEEIDLDMDGDMDIIACQVASGTNANFVWYENDGSGNFSYHFIKNIANGGAMPHDIKVADMDNDLDLDIVAISYPYTYVLYNDGNENFTSYTLPSLYQDTYTAAIYDIDNDNLKDILIWDGQMSYCKNNNGSFSSPVPLTLNTTSGVFNVNPKSIEVADMDGDLDADIVFTAGLSSIGYMENIGALTYNRSSINTTITNNSYDLKLADIEGDGDNDIIVGCANGLFLGENTSSGFVFSDLVSISASSAYANIYSVQCRDMDNDNDSDIVFSSYTGNRISWLEQCQTSSSTINKTACTSYTSPSGNYTWTTSNTYADTIPNTSGCDSIITINLTIIPPKTGTHNETVCFGGSILVNGTTYDANKLTGTEVFTNVGVNGCDSTVTVNLTILPAIDIATTTTSPTITANQTGATYQWLDCNNGNSIIVGETGQSFTATANGSYAVIVNNGACSDTSACVNIITTSVENNTLFKDVAIYPNPNKGTVNINLGNLQNTRIKIFNISGQLIYSKENINTTLVQFNLKTNAGVYFVEVYSNGDSQRFKLFIE